MKIHWRNSRCLVWATALWRWLYYLWRGSCGQDVTIWAHYTGKKCSSKNKGTKTSTRLFFSVCKKKVDQWNQVNWSWLDFFCLINFFCYLQIFLFIVFLKSRIFFWLFQDFFLFARLKFFLASRFFCLILNLIQDIFCLIKTILVISRYFC